MNDLGTNKAKELDALAERYEDVPEQLRQQEGKDFDINYLSNLNADGVGHIQPN